MRDMHITALKVEALEKATTNCLFICLFVFVYFYAKWLTSDANDRLRAYYTDGTKPLKKVYAMVIFQTH